MAKRKIKKTSKKKVSKKTGGRKPSNKSKASKVRKMIRLALSRKKSKKKK